MSDGSGLDRGTAGTGRSRGAARVEGAVETYNGMNLVVVDVAEFEDVPLLCRKSLGDVLARNVGQPPPRCGRARRESSSPCARPRT